MDAAFLALAGLLPFSFAFAAGAMLTLVVVELAPQGLRARWPLRGRGRDRRRRCSHARARGVPRRGLSRLRLAAAREAYLDSHRRLVRRHAGQPRVDHELAIITTIELERRDHAAAVALEKIDDETFEFVP